MTEEIRITDPNTGGMKGSKLPRFDLIPPEFLWALAEHYGKGAEKYDDDNWLRGYDWGLSIAAKNRHAKQFEMGEDYDEETGSHHLIAEAWHCIALYIFQKYGLGTDTRFHKRLEKLQAEQKLEEIAKTAAPLPRELSENDQR